MVIVLERPNNYKYDRLSSEDGSFRLLEILPASSRDALIECRLQTANIGRAAGTYACLSYQWGAPGRGLVIQLDGEEFRIQRNLWLFLRQLRYYGHFHLWVDAICINQNDIAERGQQVQLMNRIYPSAARVLVWLGDAADYSDAAFQFLQYINNAHASANVYNTPKVYRSLFGDEDEAHIWVALGKLCERDYWTRLWVIQEILLAKELIIFCGDRQLTWDAFKYACAGPASVKGFPGIKMADNVFGPVHQAKMTMSKTQFRELSHQKALARPRYLQQLVEAYGTAQCTDIRDRIYGLLGLSRDWTEESGMRIDYNRTEFALLVDTLCSSHIGKDVSKFGHLLIHVLRLDQHDGGFSHVFGEALAPVVTPLVSSNAPWMESPMESQSPTFDFSLSSVEKSLTEKAFSLARDQHHKVEIKLRTKVTAVFASGLGTSRIVTHRDLNSYAHVPVQVNDLVFSMPETATGLIYRPSSQKTLEYVGWAIPEAALNDLDPFWISDEGIDASLKFLTSLSKEDLQINAVSDTLNQTVQVSVYDLLFLLACSPNGYQETEKTRPTLWWGKPSPLQPTDNCFEITFREPDPRFEKRARTWRY